MLTMARKKKPPTVSVYMRLPKTLKIAMEQLSELHRRPLVTEFEIAIEEYVAKHRPEPETNGHRRD